MSVLATILQRQQRNQNRQFEPARLPTPQDFYSRYQLAVTSQGWNMVRCPFHDDRHASLSINGTHGGYICHACHSKGSMIGFYMQYHGCDFKTAINAIKL